MVTRRELGDKYKIKVLLKGPSGTSKTYTCVKIANYVASKGYKVLYLDFERGCIEELMELNDDILNKIIYKEFSTYKDLVTNINDYHDDKDVKLMIIDQMPLKEIARLSARDVFLDQGYYYIGEKMKPIDNEESFDLRGYQYQLPNTWQMKFLNDVIKCEQDIICTLLTPNKYVDEYDGKFSIIFETFTTFVGLKTLWKANPKKIRGQNLNNYPAIGNPWESLMVPFIKKYGTPDEIERARKDAEQRKVVDEEKKKKVMQQQLKTFEEEQKNRS